MTKVDGGTDREQRSGGQAARFAMRCRAAIRRMPLLNLIYRILLTVVGLLITAVGLILVPLPGPGWLVVFFGLAVLGSEYRWARSVLGWLRRVLARFWERWKAWHLARQAS